jgi:LPS-assembly lipoprotein
MRALHRLVLFLVVAGVLSGCGFRMRGADGSYNMPFHSIYIGLPDTSPLGAQIKRNLRSTDQVVIAGNAAEADAQLIVVSEQQGRQILSLNSLGRAREYLLTYTMTFTVRDRKGAELLPPTPISLRRNLAFDETQVLAKEAEAALLYRDMQADAVQQILRQLSALKPAA